MGYGVEEGERGNIKKASREKEVMKPGRRKKMQCGGRTELGNIGYEEKPWG
jgi:hypothetical protein